MRREYTRARPMIDAHVALISEQLITAAAPTRLINCAARHHPNFSEQTNRLRLSAETTEATVSAAVSLMHTYFCFLFFYPAWILTVELLKKSIFSVAEYIISPACCLHFSLDVYGWSCSL